MSNEQERAAFEAWAKKEAIGLGHWRAGRIIAQAAWQARAALAAQQVAAAPQAPAVPQRDDADRLLREVFALCEATEDAPEVDAKNEHQKGFDRGRRFEAKQIRRSIGAWFQDEFCRRSFMGEPAVPKAPAVPDTRKVTGLVDSLVATINQAHLSKHDDERDACFAEADRLIEVIADAIDGTQAPAVPKDDLTTRLSRKAEALRDAHPGESAALDVADLLGEAVSALSAPQAPAVPDGPFLVRDVAEILGVSVPDVCKVLIALGHSQRSTNMSITPDEGIAVAKWLRAAQPAPQAPRWLSEDEIRIVFMVNGFTVKEGQTDLKPYVFKAAKELLRAAGVKEPT